MTPEPGAQVRVVFTGAAEEIYHAGGHPDGVAVEMLPVRLPGGHLVYVPLVDGIAITAEAAET